VVGSFEDVPLLGDRIQHRFERRAAVGISECVGLDLGDHLLEAAPNGAEVFYRASHKNHVRYVPRVVIPPMAYEISNPTLFHPLRPSHPQSIKAFARTARKRMRTESGGYRRDYLRALAQRVEVDAQELRIMGSKSQLLRTLVVASSEKTAGFGVPSFVPKWRAIQNKTANSYIIEIAI
jgi:hypothetical protein